MCIRDSINILLLSSAIFGLIAHWVNMNHKKTLADHINDTLGGLKEEVAGDPTITFVSNVTGRDSLEFFYTAQFVMTPKIISNGKFDTLISVFKKDLPENLIALKCDTVLCMETDRFYSCLLIGNKD